MSLVDAEFVQSPRLIARLSVVSQERASKAQLLDLKFEGLGIVGTVVRLEVQEQLLQVPEERLPPQRIPQTEPSPGTLDKEDHSTAFVALSPPTGHLHHKTSAKMSGETCERDSE